MKAAIMTDTSVRVADVPWPEPGPGQLLLRVAGAGICGTDLHAHAMGMPPATVLGHEFAGTVEALGAGATGFAAGDRVCAMPVIACGVCPPCATGDCIHCRRARLIGLGDVTGGFAEAMVVGAGEAFHLPPWLDLELGALVEPLAVGLNAVERAAVAPGERVAVIGAGPVGLAITLWLRQQGVGDIAVSDPVGGRRALAEACGATATVDPAVEALSAACRRFWGQRPEVVIEAAGARGTLGLAIDLAPNEGRIVVAGMHQGAEEVPPRKAFMKGLRIDFATWYRHRHFRHTVGLLEQRRLDPAPLVTHRVTLDGLALALEELRRPNTQGKVLVIPGG